MKNLKDIMEELGHSWIDILKVDIDGAEWRSFDYIYQQMHTVPSSQIQVELTGLDITDQPDSLAGGTLGVYKLWYIYKQTNKLALLRKELNGTSNSLNL